MLYTAVALQPEYGLPPQIHGSKGDNDGDDVEPETGFDHVFELKPLVRKDDGIGRGGYRHHKRHGRTNGNGYGHQYRVNGKPDRYCAQQGQKRGG